MSAKFDKRLENVREQICGAKTRYADAETKIESATKRYMAAESALCVQMAIGAGAAQLHGYVAKTVGHILDEVRQEIDAKRREMCDFSQVFAVAFEHAKEKIDDAGKGAHDVVAAVISGPTKREVRSARTALMLEAKKLARHGEEIKESTDKALLVFDEIARHLSAIRLCRAPDYGPEVAVSLDMESAAVATMDDDAFVELLRAATSEKKDAAKMKKLTAIVKNLTEGIKSAEARIVKLAERARKDSGVEGAAARQIREKIKTTAETIAKRRATVAGLVLVAIRRKMGECTNQMAEFDLAYGNADAYLKSIVAQEAANIERPLRLLGDAHEAHKKGGGR